VKRGISFRKRSTAAIYCFFTVPLVAATLVTLSRVSFVDSINIGNINSYERFLFQGRIQYGDFRKRKIYINISGKRFYISCGNPDYPSDCIKYNKNIDKDEFLILNIAKISDRSGLIISAKSKEGNILVKEINQINYINNLNKKLPKKIYMDAFFITFFGSFIMMVIPSIIIIKNSGEKSNV